MKNSVKWLLLLSGFVPITAFAAQETFANFGPDPAKPGWGRRAISAPPVAPIADEDFSYDARPPEGSAPMTDAELDAEGPMTNYFLHFVALPRWSDPPRYTGCNLVFWKDLLDPTVTRSVNAKTSSPPTQIEMLYGKTQSLCNRRGP